MAAGTSIVLLLLLVLDLGALHILGQIIEPNAAEIVGQDVAAAPQRDLLAQQQVPSAAELRKLAAAMDPELMQYAPTPGSWDSSYKNPCWKVGAEARCIPYLYVAGSFQAGAHDLFDRMIMHKDIITVRAGPALAC